MSSVTKRIKEIKQPLGGYIKPSMMKITSLADGKILNENENIHGIIVGMAVDYMTRFLMGAKKVDAFRISIEGAARAMVMSNPDAGKEIKEYLDGIEGLDKKSIINACKAVTFDVWKRNPMGAFLAKKASEINPDDETIENIKLCVERSLGFWEIYGPITKAGFTFPGGYTSTVDSGDGDYLTKDTLWDFKVSKTVPKSSDTLQLLMYYIMGQHSAKEEFKSITKIGIFNPRLNKVYELDINCIPDTTIKLVEKDVICYD